MCLNIDHLTSGNMFRREKKTRLLKSLQQWQKGRWTRCKRSSRHTPGINIDLARYDRNVRYQSCHCLTCQVCQVGTQGINLFQVLLLLILTRLRFHLKNIFRADPQFLNLPEVQVSEEFDHVCSEQMVVSAFW